MILDTIVARKREEVDSLLQTGIAEPDSEIDPPRGFRSALENHNGLSVIAEAKKASPSKGLIRPDFNPVQIAQSYKNGGAQAMSVLTDVDFFQGSLDYIPLVREAVDLPVLRKDFIVHEIQVKEAGIYGADAILLIAAILEETQIKDYHDMAQELGMDVLVEVHNEKELEKILAAGSTMVGINNRNLNDFSVDLETTFRLKKEIPAEIPVISESGIRDRDDMKRLEDIDVCAALIGETFMRAVDPGSELRKLTGRVS